MNPKDSLIAWWGSRAKELAHAYQSSINPETPHGQAILADLARLCYAGQTTVVTGMDRPMDPLLMAFNEGKRTVFLHLCDALGISVHGLILNAFHQENKE